MYLHHFLTCAFSFQFIFNLSPTKTHFHPHPRRSRVQVHVRTENVYVFTAIKFSFQTWKKENSCLRSFSFFLYLPAFLNPTPYPLYSNFLEYGKFKNDSQFQ
jgi:hypothetical protein